MSKKLFIFGVGYTALRLAQTLQRTGWQVHGTVRSDEKAEWLTQLGITTDIGENWCRSEIADASHILSSVPPHRSWDGTSNPDPILDIYTDALAAAPARWLGYLSTTGVYGDTHGEWVDETAPIGGGRNAARDAADAAWQALEAPVHIFRLPGIYGPGRSQLERAERGNLSRVAKPGHVFSRIHVDDVAQTIIASMEKPTTGDVYNVVDDHHVSRHEVEEYACELLGLPCPPLQPFQTAKLSAMGRSFYAQNRRVSNTKIKEKLGVTLIYPTYKEGLRGCLAERKLPIYSPSAQKG